MARAPFAAWLQQVLSWRDALPASCACAVVFPGYRPDLVSTLAAALEARFVDFRKSKMAPLGWQAANLTTDVLSASAREEMAFGRDVVLHNAEALLSLVPREEREAWFEITAREAWPHRLILPLTLYAHDLPPSMLDRVTELQVADLPSDGVLQRVGSLA